jgi:hypothetical protein
LAWIVDVELVEAAPGPYPDVLKLTFDVIYPGETWCRCLVRLTAGMDWGTDDEVVARGRDALLGLLALEPGPAAADIRLTPEGLVVLALGRS